jgi:cellulose synthase/poly-beta-1,6-N-acetylglucosamine synthase-like glycosyltransferase
MWIDWYLWIAALRPAELALLLAGLLLLDGTRYAFSAVAMLAWDFLAWTRAALFPRAPREPWRPSLCALLVGHNEAATIERTLSSIHGTYPGLEIIVVDDGSSDGMAEVAQRFADAHEGVLVLRRERRGGKSSGMNFGLSQTRADVVVAIDCDSYLGAHALERLVQPLCDPRVGAVAGTVIVRNPRQSLLVRLQAFEYLRSIFVGRLFSARLGILGIVSGAFGAFRREALQRTLGWDVGPPEDLDLVLALRKCGYRIACAQHSYCFTKTPTSWKRLLKQRMRWDESGVIRNHCRKHLDMVSPFASHFRASNLVLFLESWLTNLVTLAGTWVWVLTTLLSAGPDLGHTCLTLYLAYVGCEALNALVILAYSERRVRDLLTCLVVPLAPLYQAVLLVQRTLSLLREGFLRTSFRDDFVPRHVRDATWHW